MTSSSELPNYSESSGAEKYAAPEQGQGVQNPYMQPGGQVQYAPQPHMQPGGQVQYVHQPHMQPGGQVPFFTPPNMHPGPFFISPSSLVDPSIAKIRDWLPWSISNLFAGWLFLGILPLVCSIICRRRKTSNNASGARTMSTLALILNILVTLAGIGAWIGLIVAIVLARKTVDTFANPYTTRCYYGLC